MIWPQLATPKHKKQSNMVPLLDDYLLVKGVRDRWTPCGDNDDQRILPPKSNQKR